MKLGLIAEDDSDVAVIREITLKLLKPKTVGFRSFVGNGGGKLRRKAGAWASNLREQGSRFIVVVHDLDAFVEAELRAELVAAIKPAKAKASVVLIPKREIEAWLLYDAKAIADTFRETKLSRLPGNPESIADPKKALGTLVWSKYHKRYLNTVHNAQIAKHLDLSLLARCKSFAPHLPFVAAVKKLL